VIDRPRKHAPVLRFARLLSLPKLSSLFPAHGPAISSARGKLEEYSHRTMRGGSGGGRSGAALLTRLSGCVHRRASFDVRVGRALDYRAFESSWKGGARDSGGYQVANQHPNQTSSLEIHYRSLRSAGSGNRRGLRGTSLDSIVSSDLCREIVSDDRANQKATPQAFQLMSFIIRQRLLLGRLTVADATSVKSQDRKQFLKLARALNFQAALVVFNVPLDVCLARNSKRDRIVPRQAIALQHALLSPRFLQ
jgi:hypothetical protein